MSATDGKVATENDEQLKKGTKRAAEVRLFTLYLVIS